MIKVYLDNCCYNRPFDDQSQMRIFLETDAKIQIQEMIQEGTLLLVCSYILWEENNNNPKIHNKDSISRFILQNASYFISINQATQVEEIAISIQKTGIKAYDALHIASAIIANCDYFITTDNRILKYSDPRIVIHSPIAFVQQLSKNHVN